MRKLAVLGVSLASLIFVFARSPEERTITDPASVTSPRNASAAPVPIVSRGYTVIAPNVRGSTGYGMTFQHMNYQDLGGGDLQDEVYAAKFLAATGYVDASEPSNGSTGISKQRIRRTS